MGAEEKIMSTEEKIKKIIDILGITVALINRALLRAARETLETVRLEPEILIAARTLEDKERLIAALEAMRKKILEEIHMAMTHTRDTARILARELATKEGLELAMDVRLDILDLKTPEEDPDAVIAARDGGIVHLIRLEGDEIVHSRHLL